MAELRFAKGDQAAVRGNVLGEDGAPADAHSLLETLAATGIALIRNLDPSSPEVILGVANLIGTLDLGIDEELAGPTVMDLRVRESRIGADKITPEEKPAYFTSNFFPLHTDVSYVPTPPEFMLLHCAHPDPGGGGVTLLADCDEAAALISAQDRAMLSQQVFKFLYPPNCPVGESDTHAICAPQLWRFKHAAMCIPHFAESAVANFHRALEQVSVTFFLERGDLLIVDNYRIAHGRTAFNPAPHDGPGRHILRVYANRKLENEVLKK